MVFGEDFYLGSYWASRIPMYRQQQQQQQANGYPVPGSPAGAPPGAPGTTHWFPTTAPGYHPHVPHQGGPEVAAAAAAAATGAYCMNEHQMWSHHIYPTAGGDFADFHHQQHHQQQQQLLQDTHHHHHHLNHHQQQDTAGSSPPMTISGSDMSAGSPGTAGVGPVSPHLPSQAGRPPPVRSPYEWIKKSAYQNQQPNPESGGSEPVLLDFGDSFTALSIIGKTRTKDKYRVVYTDHQRVELEKEFYYSRYITIRRKAELANNLGLSERQVKIWFQNRRAKERKQVKKREEFNHKDNIMNINHMTQQTQQQIHQQLSPGILPVTMM